MKQSVSLGNSRCHSRKGSPQMRAEQLQSLSRKGSVRKMVLNYLREKLPPLHSGRSSQFTPYREERDAIGRMLSTKKVRGASESQELDERENQEIAKNFQNLKTLDKGFKRNKVIKLPLSRPTLLIRNSPEVVDLSLELERDSKIILNSQKFTLHQPSLQLQLERAKKLRELSRSKVSPERRASTSRQASPLVGSPAFVSGVERLSTEIVNKGPAVGQYEPKYYIQKPGAISYAFGKSRRESRFLIKAGSTMSSRKQSEQKLKQIKDLAKCQSEGGLGKKTPGFDFGTLVPRQKSPPLTQKYFNERIFKEVMRLHRREDASEPLGDIRLVTIAEGLGKKVKQEVQNLKVGLRETKRKITQIKPDRKFVNFMLEVKQERKASIRKKPMMSSQLKSFKLQKTMLDQAPGASNIIDFNKQNV